MVDFIVSALQTVWGWFVGVIEGATAWILDGILAAVDAALVAAGLAGGTESFDLAGVAPYFGAINQWVPLDVCAVLFGAYWTFVASFVAIKMTLKLVPTIG